MLAAQLAADVLPAVQKALSAAADAGAIPLSRSQRVLRLAWHRMR